MALYSRHQILVIVALVAALGLGVFVNRWRTGNPDAVERLERFDREAFDREATAAREARAASLAQPTGPAATAPAQPPGAAVTAPAHPPMPTDQVLASPPAAGGPARARPPKLRQEADTGAASLDLNRATASELTALPGIGPALAARIVEARDQRPFSSVEDLRRVRGLGAAKRERLRPLVSVSSPE